MKYNEQYNDSQVANGQQAQLMSKDYHYNQQTKEQDLLNLYEELRKQREYMLSNNSDHSLDNLIESTDNHISILNTMLRQKSVKSYQIEPNTPQPHYRPYIPNNIYKGNNEYRNYINNSSNSTQPSPPNNNIDNNNSQPNGSGQPNTNNNVPNINNDSTPTPPPNLADNNTRNDRNRTRLNSRSSPLQSGIATIARAIMGRFKPINRIYDDQYRNRFHNTVVESASCKPHNKLITNECNILRLLLLYITLHPHCRHCSTLSTIATDRLGILMQLM